MKYIFKIDNFITAAIALVFLFFLPQIYNADWLNQLQNTVQDLQVTDMVFSRIRNINAVPVDTNIVIVNIGYLQRKQIAEQINILNRYDPKVIGIDVQFFKTKPPEQDIPLAMALSNVKNLVMVSKLEYNEDKKNFDSISLPNPEFLKYANTGFANFIIGEEEFKTTRVFSPIEKHGNETELAFSVKIAQLFNSKSVDKFLKRNNEVETINFRRNINKYRILDINDVFLKQDSLDLMKGKIILMGFLGPDTSTLVNEDVFYTPMNLQYIGKTFPDMYGVVIHANIISMILSEDYINTIPLWVRILLIVLIAFGIMTLFTIMRETTGEWYESASLVALFVSMALLMSIIVVCLLEFNFILSVQEGVIIFMITEMISESYHGSLKPLSIDAYKFIKKKFFNKKKKKNLILEDGPNNIEKQ
jgi:CHASE2 domain-containing sensor protein